MNTKVTNNSSNISKINEDLTSIKNSIGKVIVIDDEVTRNTVKGFLSATVKAGKASATSVLVTKD